MIKALSLKFGRAPGLPTETITTTPVTVFVGPNNSGKSKILTEIHQYCTTGRRNTSNVLVEQIGFESLSRDLAEERIHHVTLRPHVTETLQPDHIIVGKREYRKQLQRELLIQSLLHPNTDAIRFCQWYLTYNTLMLDGRSRISLIDDQDAGDLQQPPETSFQALLRDNEKRAEVRRIVHDAFNAYLVIDPTKRGGPRNSDRLLRWIPTSEWRDRNHAETEKIPR